MRAFGFSIVLLSFILTNPVYGQAPPRANFNLDELIERLFPVQDDDLDYESIYEVLFQLYQNPIDINKADMETLQSTFLLLFSHLLVLSHLFFCSTRFIIWVQFVC